MTDPATNDGRARANAPPAARRPPPLGAILAGGRNRRFGGEPKALMQVGGLPIIERVRDALSAVVPDVVLVANDPAPYERLGLSVRGDVFAGAGPLAGLHAALTWARERGAPGALCVACDMPFVTTDVLGGVRGRAGDAFTRGVELDAVVPASDGPRGIEPLCAYYAVSALDEIERRLRAGAGETARLLDALDVEIISRADVARWGDPAVLFLNVNDPAELRRARSKAAVGGPGDGGPPGPE